MQTPTDRFIFLTALVIFSILWFMDAWLSAQFISDDIINEANPVIRELIGLTGNIFYTLFLIKLVVLVISGGIFLVTQNKRPNHVMGIVTVLIITLVFINSLSYQMVQFPVT